MRTLLALLLLADAVAASHVDRYYRKNGTYVSAYERVSRSSSAAPPRTASGRIKRNPATKREFERLSPCPSTLRTSGPCPGYVVDHITPLSCGGEDATSNMQWQSVEAAGAKDRIERQGCGVR